MPNKSTRQPKPLYRRKTPPLPGDPLAHAKPIAPAHFELREDGSIQAAQSPLPSPPPGEKVVADQMRGHVPHSKAATSPPPGEKVVTDQMRGHAPQLVFSSDSPWLRLYHGNALELLDAIHAKYGDDGRFDCIFADPPYFLSNGGITCHAGRMVKVDKGDWDKSRGPELNHEFNVEWLRRCQRVLKPNGTIWVTGTHHVIFSIGYAMQQLGYKILNDIAWEKPNPPPNLSCRYFTHSTETVLWAAKTEKSKHVFNYQEMKAVSGKQMKTVWRNGSLKSSDSSVQSEELKTENLKLETQASKCNPSLAGAGEGGRRPGEGGGEEPSSIWTLGAPSRDEKVFGKHPTQKPIALVERCLLAATNPDDLVLDPFLGGGTTAIAALRLNRRCVGVEADLHNVHLAEKRVDREIIEIWLRHFRVRVDITVLGRAVLPRRPNIWAGGASVLASRAISHLQSPNSKKDLDLFSDSINGSRCMADVPQIETERIFHECKFVFLSCAHVERGSVVHTTVDVSLQEAWAKTPTGKKRETTHVVRCETEIFRVKSS